MKKENGKLYLNYSDIENAVSDIGRTILQGDWRPDYIVGITRGGLLPAALLSQYLNVPMQSLNVTLRDNTEMGPESNCWMAEDAFGYVDTIDRKTIEETFDPDKRKNILILDDINDTGATLSWIQHDWTSSCMPDDNSWDTIWGSGGNVRSAVIVNNESSDYTLISYSGTTINKAEDNTWVVFPWEDWWKRRNGNNL